MHDISTLIYCINFSNQNKESKIDSEATYDIEKNVKMEPSEASIKNILDFARSYDVIETKSAGYVEMILN